ncbi:uncharacterized protein [Chironomus tepperi]|uniref:uncharacterized protein isoform X2 n=1 Tax=Chironomus tepperi TaxID=113505 RepID=UPI00391F9C3F
MGVGCVICTEEFSAWQVSDKVSVVIKGCGHVFHDCCLKLWLKNSRTCPVCRQATFDSPNYISRVHLQRLSLDNTSVNSILDESLEQKKKLEELELKLKKKEAELQKKEIQIKELNKLFADLSEHANKVTESVKGLTGRLHNRVEEIKDEDNPVTSSRETIQPRPSITRTVRVPIPTISAAPPRPTRPLMVPARISNILLCLLQQLQE